jgi:hypothetical protein
MDIAAAEQTAERTESPADKKKRKKEKVRSAWISFAGRIVAQLVGAIATVALGVMVLHRYTSADTRPGPAAAQQTSAAQPAAQIIVVTPAMLGLRDADERIWAGDRACTPQLDGPAASTAHLDHGTLLRR